MSEKRERRHLAIPAVAVIVVVVVILSLFIALSQRTLDLDDGDHSEGLYLRIETDKSVYDRGEEVVFSVFFVNEEDTDFSYTHSGSRSWDIVVFDSRGREVVNSSAGWIDHTGISTLEVPANSQKIAYSNFSWDQTPDPWSSEDQLLPPDYYLLRFYLKDNREIFGEARILIS